MFKISYDNQSKVFELENNFYIKFKEAQQTGYGVEDKDTKYDNLYEAGLKLYVTLLNYLDKHEKELSSKGINSLITLLK